MFTALTAAASLALAHEIGRRIDSIRSRWSQQMAFDVLGASVLWLASAWLLAGTHELTRAAVIARTALFAAAAIALAIRRSGNRASGALRADGWEWMIGLLPLVLWTGFILWRGALLPPVNHDALSYHLPKAIFYVRAEGFDPLPALDWRERKLPVNYEILVADAIAGSGDDRFTEWISTWFYLAFVIAGVALADRWRPLRPPAAVATALVTAGVPVLLLHSGAHKNDVMTGFFMVSALLWAGCWFRDRDRPSVILTVVSLAAAIGTKPQAMALAGALAPLVVWPLWTDVRRPARFVQRLTLLFVFSTAVFLMLGGSVYVLENYGGGRSQSVVMYGDWANLWQGPYVLLAAPFSRHPNLLNVPWESRPWFWERYELFFSEFGIPFVLCVVALPLVIAAIGRRAGREPLAITAAALATFAVMLPVRFVPHGLFAISLPRYALFVLPVVFAWTIPLLMERGRALQILMVVTAAGWFLYYAADNAVDDRFAPLDYVMWVAAHPGSRIPSHDHSRGALVADAISGPGETMAVESAYGTWIYPAFGSALRRPVVLLPDASDPRRIPDAVRTVVIDRAFDAIWQNPAFRDLSQWREYLMHGVPRDDDVRLFRALSADPRFALVYRDAARNQAVFRRRR